MLFLEDRTDSGTDFLGIYFSLRTPISLLPKKIATKSPQIVAKSLRYRCEIAAKLLQIVIDTL